MVFGGHRAVFGRVDHDVLPRGPVPPAAPEETAWDARTGPIGTSRGTESLERFALAFRARSVCASTPLESREAWGRLCTAPDVSAIGRTGCSPGAIHPARR